MGLKDTITDVAGRITETVDKGIEAGKDGFQKMTEKGRITKEMNQLNSEINEIYIKVGKAFYAASPNSDEFSEEFTSLREKKAKVQSLKNQLSLLEGNVICPACGAAVPGDSKICNQCGTTIVIERTEQPQTVAAEVITDEVRFCPECGSKVNADAKFCGKCGKKL